MRNLRALGIKWTNGRAEDIRRRFQPKSHPILREEDWGTNITKRKLCKNAVNNFVEQTAKMNDSIDDIKLQHRVSLVKFGK